MESEVCQYSKHGFCKFKEARKRKHYKENCRDLSDCQQIKTCPSRHSKTCKRYASGSCRFKNECAYSHRNDHKLRDKCEHTDKIDILEMIKVNLLLCPATFSSKVVV